MKTTDAIASKTAPRQGITFDKKPSSATLTSCCDHIRTTDELLRKAAVDLTEWEVHNSIVNTWEGYIKHGYGERATIRKTTLWQIKVSLRKKHPTQQSVEELLRRITKHSLAISKPKPARKSANRRSLEISIPDPHVGLLCDYPEADGPQSLESAASLMMTAVETLIARAASAGPFEEVFMPIGNDFVHADTIAHSTTAGTLQPEAIAWHKVYVRAEELSIQIIERLRKVAAQVFIYEVPGNHSRMSDFTLCRILRAYFRSAKDVHVDASSSPYKFHRFGTNLIGYEHGHSIPSIRLAALMANERKDDWPACEYREWHLGDQHRKGSSNPCVMEEQGVSVEYVPGLCVPNEWHRIKSFNHQKRGAMAWVYDFSAGPILRTQFNISSHHHQPMR